MSGWGRKSGFCTFPPQGRELGAGGSSGGKKQLITHQDKNYFYPWKKKVEKRLSTRRREGGDQSLLSRYCRRSQLTQGFFVYFLGDIFFGNRRFVVHCFLAHRPKVMRMIYYLIQVLRRKKKMLNLCTIQIQWWWRHLAFKFIRYDDNVIWWSSFIRYGPGFKRVSKYESR